MFKKDISFKEFIMFLIPSIAVMAFMSTYAIVDGYFVSKYVSSDALAAVNLILPINSIIYAVGLMFAAGGGAFSSIKLGEGDSKAASKFFSNLLMVAVIFGLVVMVIALTFKGQLLAFLGVNGALYSYGSVYSIFAIVTFPFIITKMIFTGFLRAEGQPKVSLKMSILGGSINMVLDFIFIVVMKMGVAGAGLGTLLGIIISLIYAGRYFKSEKSVLKFKLAAIEWKLVINSMVNGSSEMVSELAIGFTSFVLNTLTIKHFGKDGVAAIAVILYVNFFVSMIYQGIAIGTSPLLSYHYGAKNYNALAKVRKYTSYTIGVTSLLLSMIVFFYNYSLVSIFFRSDNMAYSIAVNALSIVAFAYLLMGVNMYGSAMYTALSNGKISAVISFSKTFIIFAGASYIIPKIMGSEGIWFILPVVEVITALMVFYLTRERQLERYTGLKFYEETRDIAINDMNNVL
ncbi:MAG: MATE family efflux transporter [Firmicutes bacterium]|jgi:putative MATE family efflux protein|nr:MATE family efflux transporter [Bacillota bacterium]